MMTKDSGQVIQAFPLGMGTDVFTSGVTNYEVLQPKILHMNESGTITLSDGVGSVVISAEAGSDWAISNDVKLLTVDVSCLLS
jgi:acyl-CoA hydrolase